MFLSSSEHRDALRKALQRADRDNTRQTAALLGSAIAGITWATQDDPEIRAALEIARTAGLELLEELTRNKNPEAARTAAFKAFDALSALLPDAAPVSPRAQDSPAPPIIGRKVTSWGWKARRA